LPLLGLRSWLLKQLCSVSSIRLAIFSLSAYKRAMSIHLHYDIYILTIKWPVISLIEEFRFHVNMDSVSEQLQHANEGCITVSEILSPSSR
jgi:hypothetical protein